MTKTPELLLTEVVDDNNLLFMVGLKGQSEFIIILDEFMCITYNDHITIGANSSEYTLHLLINFNSTSIKMRDAYTRLAFEFMGLSHKGGYTYSGFITTGSLSGHLKDIGIKLIMTDKQKLEFILQYSGDVSVDLEEVFRMANKIEDMVYILKQMAVEDRWDEMECISL